MTVKRGKRRADGSLRPAVVRARARRKGAPFVAHDAHERFRSITISGTRIWNSFTLREQLELDHHGVGATLERAANVHRWAKLRDTAGTVRAIGLPRNHPDLRALHVRNHRTVMVARVTGVVAVQREGEAA